MGDIADMMLEGILCESCGEFIGEPVGYPRCCGGCRPDSDAEDEFWQAVQEEVDAGATVVVARGKRQGPEEANDG